MPARTVVIEKLTKFTGEHHQRLTPGEYTQLTGRAGRRGIDDLGNAVVLWSPWVRFDEVAELAGSTSFHLRSAFRPTYNMAANLIRTYTSEQAHHLLNLSFAQYQADRDIVRLEARLDRLRPKLVRAPPRGGQRLRRHRGLSTPSRPRPPIGASADRARAPATSTTLIGSLRPGAIIDIAAPKHSAGRVVLLATAHRKGGAPSDGRQQGRARPERSPSTISRTCRSCVGSHPAPRRVRTATPGLAQRGRQAPAPGQDQAPGEAHRSRRCASGRASGIDGVHPVEHDPDLRAKLRAAGEADRVAREIADIERRVAGKNQSLGHDFDRVLDVLSHLRVRRRSTRGS